MSAPGCPKCQRDARLTDGREVYPRHADLHDKPIWKCDGCGGYVGCHPGGTVPLGTPADAPLRRARMILHNEVIDPLWMEADRSGLYKPEDSKARKLIRRSARHRVYAFLADKLGLERDQTHIGNFDLETCRKAWRALNGVTYAQIREWAKARKESA